MAISEDYLNYVLDQLSPLEGLRSKRMFGGIGLYAEGLFFALIEEETLRFKVDDHTRETYLAHGSTAFKPFPDKKTVMQYYEVPIEILEDQDKLCDWAKAALDVARRKKKKG